MNNITLSRDTVEQWLEDLEYSDSDKNVIAAIKQALAAQPAVQEPVAVARVDDLERGGRVRALAMGLALDAALYTTPPAQPAPVQECLVCNGMGFIDGVGAKCRRCDGRGLTLATTPPAAPTVQDLPFGVGGGLVAIKTLLSRDPCVHANTAIEMIDAILKEHPAAQRQWVGLTPDDIRQLEKENTVGGLHGDYCPTWDLIELVEAKLKEKNT